MPPHRDQFVFMERRWKSGRWFHHPMTEMASQFHSHWAEMFIASFIQSARSALAGSGGRGMTRRGIILWWGMKRDGGFGFFGGCKVRGGTCMANLSRMHSPFKEPHV